MVNMQKAIEKNSARFIGKYFSENCQLINQNLTLISNEIITGGFVCVFFAYCLLSAIFTCHNF